MSILATVVVQLAVLAFAAMHEEVAVTQDGTPHCR
jgi:hypothetical protein